MAGRVIVPSLGLIFALALCGCGASVAPRLPATGSAVMAQSSRPAGVRDALYVSAINQNRVDGFSAHRKNPPPFRELTKGILAPAGMAVDASGNLYVANQGGSSSGSVTVYRAHHSKPFLTYTDKVQGPVDVAVAPDGTTYISNLSSGAVTVYPPGSTTCSMTLMPPPNATPTGVTTDYTGRVYVAYATLSGSHGVIYTYAAGKANGRDLGILLSGAPHGIIVDTNGNLLVAVSVAPSSESDVEIYPPGATHPSQRFYGPLQPMMLALNPNQNRLYVADYGSGSNNGAVFVFSYPSGSLRSKDTQGAAQAPYGVVFDRS
jgi:DNA-binding beta-propeller fold protein YncE